MGHSKEPKGVDFLLESKPLTERELEKISEFIKKREKMDGNKHSPKKKPTRTKKPTHNNMSSILGLYMALKPFSSLTQRGLKNK